MKKGDGGGGDSGRRLPFAFFLYSLAILFVCRTRGHLFLCGTSLFLPQKDTLEREDLAFSFRFQDVQRQGGANERERQGK